jgi:hypothetical protein
MGKSVAIQIKDKGYVFRSKLEWRYTQFFDSLGIRWQYEPTTFDLTHYPGLKGFPKRLLWYIPDFYLPDFDVHLEIKPRLNDNIARLRLQGVAYTTNRPVLLSENFYAKPPVFWYSWPDHQNPLSQLTPHKRSKYACFARCSHCQRLALWPFPACNPDSRLVVCGTAHPTHPSILKAVEFSKEAPDATKIWTKADSRREGCPISRLNRAYKQAT